MRMSEQTYAVASTDGWKPRRPLLVGDRFTSEGFYQRRTLWQWLTRQPRQLQQYVIVAVSPSFIEYRRTDLAE